MPSWPAPRRPRCPTASATSAWAAPPWPRSSSSTGSTTPPSATSTRPSSRCPGGWPTAARPWPTPSPRSTRPSRSRSSISVPTACGPSSSIPAPVLRPLARIEGTLGELLADPAWATYEGHWLAVTLTDADTPRDPMDRLRQRFPGVLQLTLASRRHAAPGSYVERLSGLDDLGPRHRLRRGHVAAPADGRRARPDPHRARGRAHPGAVGLMRLHTLSLSAFGSFAGSETIDFDQLADTGLFLLHGPTGAGKTTILDAVSFALFGTVAGVRPAGHGLRSDHAEPTTPTEVRLEVTLDGRRFRIVRRPRQLRPKRRGRGVHRGSAHGHRAGARRRLMGGPGGQAQRGRPLPGRAPPHGGRPVPPDRHAAPGRFRPVPPGQRRRPARSCSRSCSPPTASPRSSAGCGPGPRPTGWR